MLHVGSPLRPSSQNIGTLPGSVILAVTYIASGWLFRTPTLGSIVDVLAWPPIGIALGLVLLWGPRVWPGMVAAALLEPLLAGIPVTRFLGSAAGLTLEVLVSAWLLRRLGFRSQMDRVRDVLYFGATAVLGGALAGSIVNTSYQILTGVRPASDFFSYCFQCYRGDALAFLLVTPVVITWGSDLRLTWLRGRIPEGAALAATLLPGAYLLTGGIHRFWRPTFPIRYLLFPWLFWAALRFGPAGVAASNLLVVTIASQGDWLRFDVPESAGEMVTNRLLLLWGYSFLGCMMGLLLAALTRQQERARRHSELIREANLALACTLDLGGVLNTLLEHLERLVPFDSGNVMLIEGRHLVVRAGRNYERWTSLQLVGTQSPVADLPMWETVREGKPVVLHDTLKEKRWIIMKGTEYVRTWLAVPLVAGGETIGLYSLDRAQPHSFTHDDARLVQSLSAQAAVAIQNARLYEQRRQAEAALAKSEERFAKAFYSHPNPMVLSRLQDGRLIDCNESYLRFFGYPREEALARPAWDFYVRPSDRDALAERIRKEQRFRDVELQLRAKSGEIRTGLASAELIEIAGEQCILGVIRDITPRRKAEEALWASEERFVKAFSANPMAMSISSLDNGRYVDVNEGYLRMLGYTREDVIGRSALDLGIWADPEKRTELIAELERSGRVVNYEIELRTKAGELRTGLLYADTVDLGGVPHLLSAVLDMTEYRRLEEQFRQSQKMDAIGRLAGGVAHDFNNLLMVMIGRADLLMVKLKEGDPALKAVEEIQKAAWRAAGLTRQLLAFSRKQRLQPRVLNLNVSVTEMEKMLRRLIGEHIQMVVEADPALGNIKADPGGIEQVLMNLSVNARDAMPEGGTLTITTSNADFDVAFPLRHGTVGPGRYVQLAVSDTGVGMDAAIQTRIFEPFFTTKEAGKGTGLGLSTVYGIVQQSGGVISVYSEPGHGTSFKLYFPMVEEKAEPVAGSSPAPLARGSETILVVEDEDAVRGVACEYLTVAGYHVLEARNGAQALDLCRSHSAPIHLLLTDVILPGMSGRELADQLRSSFPTLKIVFLSGYTSEVVSGQGLLADGSALIEKPFRLADFAAKVRSTLDAAPL